MKQRKCRGDWISTNKQAGVIARVIKLPLWYYRNKTLAVLTPAVEKQLALGKNSEADGSNFIWHAAKLSEKSIVGGIGATSKPEVIAEWIMSLVRNMFHGHYSLSP